MKVEQTFMHTLFLGCFASLLKVNQFWCFFSQWSAHDLYTIHNAQNFPLNSWAIIIGTSVYGHVWPPIGKKTLGTCIKIKQSARTGWAWSAGSVSALPVLPSVAVLPQARNTMLESVVKWREEKPLIVELKKPCLANSNDTRFRNLVLL